MNPHSIVAWLSRNSLLEAGAKSEGEVTEAFISCLSILDISKMLIYKFWYDYIKPKYGDREKLCYMDTDSFVIHIITEDFYEDIANDLERWFDASMIKERFQ